MLIETGLMRNRLSGILGLPGKLESLGSVEGRRETDLADLLGVDLYVKLDAVEKEVISRAMKTYALQRSLSSSIGLLGTLGGSTYRQSRISNRSLRTRNNCFCCARILHPTQSRSY